MTWFYRFFGVVFCCFSCVVAFNSDARGVDVVIYSVVGMLWFVCAEIRDLRDDL